MKTLTLTMLIAATLGATCGQSLAGIVSIDRILREHRVYVVTTEKPDDLNSYWISWRPREVKVMSMTELILNRSRLEDGAFVLFILDRSRLRNLIPEEEAMLPCPLSAVGPGEVLVYASKTGSKRNQTRQGRWDVMVIAPNREWLHRELARMSSSGGLIAALEERGTLISRYTVRKLTVVSNEGPRIVEEWIARQSVPGQNAIDWEFIALDTWAAAPSFDSEVLFLLSGETLKTVPVPLVDALSEKFGGWWKSTAAANEWVAERSETGDGNGGRRYTSVIAAPVARHLRLALDSHSNLDSIPRGLSRRQLSDLSRYSEMVVVVRSGDRKAPNGEGFLDDLAGKITSALSAAATGFQCVTRQDLEELIYESLLRGRGEIDPTDADAIRGEAGGACAVAVVDLAAINTQTSYTSNSPRRLTPAYPAFDEPEPTRPRRPNPSETILFRGHKYRTINGSRENDPNYKADLRHYEDVELPLYRSRLRRWESDRADYDYQRRNHEMEWEISVDSIQTARVTGNLRIYDLGTFGQKKAGEVMFSCPLTGGSERRGSFRTDRAVVRGEDNWPSSPEPPRPHEGIADGTIVSEALWNASEAALNRILTSAILPSDVTIRTAARPGNSEPPRMEKVTVEAVGSVKLLKRPTGEGLEVARDAAYVDAVSNLADKLKAAAPGSEFGAEEVRRSARIVSEGWESAAREYRVRVRYDTEIASAEVTR